MFGLNTRILRVIGLLIIAVSLMGVSKCGGDIPPFPPPEPGTEWLDNPVDRVIDDLWFTTFGYGDCEETGCGIWPPQSLDCILPDDMSGPTAADEEVVAEPPGLYYKHLAPGIEQALKSGQSLIVGLDEMCGTTLRSISLMVHPATEGLIDMTVTERVEQFFEPYVERAIGQDVPTEQVKNLYLAALYHCGEGGEDQRGLGVHEEFGDYVAVVQWWTTDTRDCNIHVVAR